MDVPLSHFIRYICGVSVCDTVIPRWLYFDIPLGMGRNFQNVILLYLFNVFNIFALSDIFFIFICFAKCFYWIIWKLSRSESGKIQATVWIHVCLFIQLYIWIIFVLDEIEAAITLFHVIVYTCTIWDTIPLFNLWLLCCMMYLCLYCIIE